MEKKNIDWKNLGFGYMQTDYRYVSNFKEGKWDEGSLMQGLQVVDQKEMMTGVLPSIRVLVSIVLPSWVSICTLGNCCADATPKVHRTARIVRQKIFFIVR